MGPDCRTLNWGDQGVCSCCIAWPQYVHLLLGDGRLAQHTSWVMGCTSVLIAPQCQQLLCSITIPCCAFAEAHSLAVSLLRPLHLLLPTYRSRAASGH